MGCTVLLPMVNCEPTVPQNELYRYWDNEDSV